MAGLCKKFKGQVDPSLAEAIAALVAVDFIIGMPFGMFLSKGMLKLLLILLLVILVVRRHLGILWMILGEHHWF